MAAKKVEAAKTRKVRVNEQRSYVDEEPIEEIIDAEIEEEASANPIQSFLQSIDNSRSLTMKVFLLPNFYKDGKRSIRANERPFVTQFPFNTEDIQDYQQRIQQACPAGGMFQMELREGWQMVRIWEEAIAAAPGYQATSATQQQHQYPIIVNPAMNPPPAPVADPMVAMERQAESFLKVAEVIKKLQPEHVASVQVETPTVVSMKDKILEGVIMQAFSGDKVPADRFDRVLEVLGGGKPETSWVDSLVQGISPHVGPLLNQIGPGLNLLLTRLATGSPVEAPPVPVQASSSGVLSEGTAASEAPPDPAEYAWRRTMMRLLDDMWEHVQATSRGMMGIDVKSSAEAVANLAERFESNETIVGIITQLLGQSPEQVIDLCAMMVAPPLQERVSSMKQANQALVWLGELQQETKAILAGDEPPSEGESNEDERTDSK